MVGLNNRYWILDAGYVILVVRYWIRVTSENGERLPSI